MEKISRRDILKASILTPAVAVCSNIDDVYAISKGRLVGKPK